VDKVSSELVGCTKARLIECGDPQQLNTKVGLSSARRPLNESDFPS
jgi:hypothetical protein